MTKDEFKKILIDKVEELRDNAYRFSGIEHCIALGYEDKKCLTQEKVYEARAHAFETVLKMIEECDKS